MRELTALSTRCLMSSATPSRLASTCLLPAEGVGSLGYSWLIHDVPRRMQFSHMVSAVAAKMQRTLRRLHSQQLWVPLRTFLRLDSGSSTWGLALAIVHRKRRSEGRFPGKSGALGLGKTLVHRNHKVSVEVQRVATGALVRSSRARRTNSHGIRATPHPPFRPQYVLVQVNDSPCAPPSCEKHCIFFRRQEATSFPISPSLLCVMCVQLAL